MFRFVLEVYDCFVGFRYCFVRLIVGGFVVYRFGVVV